MWSLGRATASGDGGWGDASCLQAVARPFETCRCFIRRPAAAGSIAFCVRDSRQSVPPAAEPLPRCPPMRRRFLKMARMHLAMGVPYFIDRDFTELADARGLQASSWMLQMLQMQMLGVLA